MEQNLPIIAKKIWKIVKVLYFMLRKGIPKGKLLADLNMILKRGKLAGKSAIQNLMFHHHHHHHGAVTTAHDGDFSFPVPLNEYEFSCSDTPAHRSFHLPFHLNKRRHSHAPPRPIDEDMMAAAIEMAASPALPGFGPSPNVRQLRVTDSPFPLKDAEEDNGVDEAAEEFIMKFYRDLRKENSKGYLGYYS